MLHIHQGFVRIECVIPLREDWITSFWFTHGPRIQGTIREGLLFPSQRFDSLTIQVAQPLFLDSRHQGVTKGSQCDSRKWDALTMQPFEVSIPRPFWVPTPPRARGRPRRCRSRGRKGATVRGVSWGGWTQEIHFTIRIIRLIYRGQIIWQNKKSSAVEWLFWDVQGLHSISFVVWCSTLVEAKWFEWSMRGIYHVVCPSNEARTTVFIPNRQISQSLLAIFAERSQV